MFEISREGINSSSDWLISIFVFNRWNKFRNFQKIWGCRTNHFSLCCHLDPPPRGPWKSTSRYNLKLTLCRVTDICQLATRAILTVQISGSYSRPLISFLLVLFQHPPLVTLLLLGLTASFMEAYLPMRPFRYSHVTNSHHPPFISLLPSARQQRGKGRDVTGKVSCEKVSHLSQR